MKKGTSIKDQTCKTCKLWKSKACWERKQSNRDAGENDWCGGWKRKGA